MSQSSTASGSVDNAFDRITIDDEEYLAHDVVAQREGVYHYPDPSGGVRREFVSGEELIESIEGIDEVDVVLSHPETPDGSTTLTTDPRANYSTVGTWRDLRPTDTEDGIAGKVYIRANEVGEHDGKLRQYLNEVKRNGVGAVSTGYDISEAPKNPGRFNGVKYKYEQQGVQHDHLALLPDEQGDCSVEDGCGLGRANQQDDAPIRVNHHIPSDTNGTDDTDTENALDGVTVEDVDDSQLREFGRQVLSMLPSFGRMNSNDNVTMEDEERINELVEEYGFTRENIAHLKGTQCLVKTHEAVKANEGRDNDNMGDNNNGEGQSSGDGAFTEEQREELNDMLDGVPSEDEIPTAEEIADELSTDEGEVDTDEIVDEAATKAAEQAEEVRAHQRNIQKVAQSDELPHIDEDRASRMNEEVVAELAEDLDDGEEEESAPRANQAGRALGGSFDPTQHQSSGGDDFDIPATGRTPGSDGGDD